ncbi:hypothetical protein [Micromonospora globbae]|uniref:DUF1918 domain-containing protein n=1 Tax=Micromonospora globbae TaxID=1894969 RepID=A0A420EQ61_9ACTN|nr:hypothetical protein [Micromonospora globbae]RKF22819.1 hypothetical protein D7I43_31350 [Micromonospora globbae]
MPDERDHEDERSLDAGEIVTVAPALVDEMGGYLYVVIDGFDDPRYTLARLGGDGYQWPNVAREHLIPVAPERIIRVDGADGEAAYIPG